jgi:hypothetical protein
MDFSFLSEVGVVLIIQIPVPYSYTKVAGPQQLQNIFTLKSYSLYKKADTLGTECTVQCREITCSGGVKAGTLVFTAGM